MKCFFSFLLLAHFALLSADNTSLTVGLQLEPPGLDPTRGASAAIDQVVYANIFEGLVRVREDGSIGPALAREWQVSADGTVYTFRLHDQVRFHDGSPLDAEDVVFTLNRARSETSLNPGKQRFADIVRVEALDRLTVEVELAAALSPFLYDLGRGDAVIVSPESAANNVSHPVGTGPFVFDSWRKGDRVTLKRNPWYWGEPARLERVNFFFISDPSAAVAALRAGDLGVFVNFPAPENLPVFERDPRFQVLVGNSEGEVILAINNARPPFDQQLVRQAVVHAIDRRALIEGAMYGYGTPIGSHFSPNHPAYIDLTSLSDFDPALARNLLTQAGYSRGFETSLILPPASYARRGGEIVAAQLRAVGIRVKVIQVAWAQWLDQVYRKKNYQLTIVAHVEPMDIAIYARSDYYFNYHNPTFNQVIRWWRASVDRTEQRSLLQQAQTIIAKDYVNGFLFQLPQLTVAAAGVRGLWRHAPIQAVDLSRVYWQ